MRISMNFMIKNSILFGLFFVHAIIGIEQSVPAPQATMATLQGLPPELKEYILSYIVNGNFKTALKSIAYLYGTCKSWNVLITDEHSMLAVLKRVHYTANAVVLALRLKVQEKTLIKDWMIESAESLEKGEELFNAINNNNINEIKDLLNNKKIDLYHIGEQLYTTPIYNSTATCSYSPLMLAIGKKHFEVVQLLLNTHINTEYFNEFLHAVDQDPTIIKMLLKAGSDPNQEHVMIQMTALEKAAKHKYKKLCTLLKNAGATLNRHNAAGQTTLTKILSSGYVSTEELQSYLDEGADVNFPDQNGKTPLMFAIADYRKIERAWLLLRYGASPNITDKKGKTAAMYAVKGYITGKQEIELLADYNADFTLKDKKGHTAYDIAKKKWEKDSSEYSKETAEVLFQLMKKNRVS